MQPPYPAGQDVLYGKNYRGEIPGWVYVHGIDKYFLDPRYWYQKYKEWGLIPKPPSKWQLLGDQALSYGIGKIADSLIGSIFGNNTGTSGGGLLGSLFGGGGLIGNIVSGISDTASNLLGSLFGTGATAGTTSSLGTAITSPLSKAVDFVGSLFSGAPATAASVSAGLTPSVAETLASVPGVVGQTATGMPIFADAATANAFQAAPLTSAQPTTSGGLLGNLTSSPLMNAAAGTLGFLQGYKEGKPNPLTIGGGLGASLLMSNPLTGMLAAIGNVAGGILGSRKKKKKIKKWANQTTDALMQQYGIDPSWRDAIYRTLRSNYKSIGKNATFNPQVLSLINKYSNLPESLQPLLRQQIARRAFGLGFNPLSLFMPGIAMTPELAAKRFAMGRTEGMLPNVLQSLRSLPADAQQLLRTDKTLQELLFGTQLSEEFLNKLFAAQAATSAVSPHPLHLLGRFS